MSPVEAGSEDNKTVFFEGVREPLPAKNGGKEAIYYCNYCQTPPSNDDPTKVVVSVGHNACVQRAQQKMELFFANLNRELDARLGVVENELANLNLSLGLDL